MAIVTESFLPQVNGVTNSVLRVCEQLTRLDHEVLVIAPGPGPEEWSGVPVVHTPSIPLPGYRDFRVALRFPGMMSTLRDFKPDVVHLASPALLGAQGALAAHRLDVPAIAIYQTDLAGFASRYRLDVAERVVWHRLRKVHALAARTLAPSRHSVEQLRVHGVQRIARWARGVDLDRFQPARRSSALHQALAPDGELVVGYVGRLAHEKQLGLLTSVQQLPGIRLVIVGDGPQRKQLQSQLRSAQFLGFQSGSALASTFASLDLFLHTGSHETFCQAAQEALSSGVPVIAPRAGGLPDLAQSGANGMLFRPGSGASLAHCVQTLARDGELRLAMSRQARKSVEGRSWAAVGQELAQHYREVL